MAPPEVTAASGAPSAALARLQAAFPQAVRDPQSFRGDDTLTVDAASIHDVLRLCRDDADLQMDCLMDETAVDYLDYPVAQPRRFALVYHLYSIQKKHRLRLKVPVDAGTAVPTASDLWKTADWFEREIWDMFGLKFQGHPNLKRVLNPQSFVGHPLRKDYPVDRRQGLPENDDLMDEMTKRLVSRRPHEDGHRDLDTELMFLNIGPAHPATHGVIRIFAALDGETIAAAVTEIGYLHRGYEKTTEHRTYNQCIPYTDRLNYVSAILNNIGFAKAVEKLLDIQITDRCAFIRVIVGEMMRIVDHLVCVGANLVDLGALTNFWYLYNQREKAYIILERLTGARLTNSFTRIGGLYRDLYDGFEGDVRIWMGEVLKAVADVTKLIQKSKIFLDRTQDICKVSAADAISWGFTGPCLRASGVDYDVRKARPYYYYDTFDWDVVLGTAGDTYDRIFVRMLEIEQSVKIMDQALKKLPGGPVNVDQHSVTLPDKAETYQNIEGLINHFKLIYEGVRVPVGEVYDYSEAANGELGFYLVADGTGRPYRSRCRGPCFPIFSAFADMIEGFMIADAIATLGSINIIAGELER